MIGTEQIHGFDVLEAANRRRTRIVIHFVALWRPTENGGAITTAVVTFLKHARTYILNKYILDLLGTEKKFELCENPDLFDFGIVTILHKSGLEV